MKLSMKNSFQKRLLPLALALLMLLPAVACAKNEEQPEPVDTTTTENTVTKDAYEYDKNGYVMDTIPSSTKYNNATAKILCWIDDANITTLPGDAGKDLMTSKLYLRRLEVEERLGLILDVKNENGGWANMDPYLEIVEKSEAGGDPFDVICSYSCTAPTMATRGLLQNLNNLAYPKTDMPWWPASVAEYEQYGSLFYIASNSSMQSLDSIMCIFSNTEMFTSRGMKDPVQEVLDGTWTVEKMLEDVRMIETTSGSGSTQYGLVVDDASRLDVFYYGAGFHNTVKDPDTGRSTLSFTDASTKERVSNLVDKLITVFNSENATVANNTTYSMMHKETAFMASGLYSVKRLQDLDYTPIPAPKLDANQTDYISVQTNGFDVWSVSKSAKTPEMSGVIIEAMASADYRKIAPQYYESHLKLRYSSGEAQARMFDILRNSVTYDFGRTNQVALKSRCEASFRYCFVQKVDSQLINNAENRYATLLDGYMTMMETELAELLNGYRKYS